MLSGVITPKLEELPVYVRGGSILPIAPLTQSTSEIPQGPLTLRVYPLAPGLNTPGESCEGDVYTDDGHTFAYRRGEFARIHFACSLEPNGSLTVSIGKQEGQGKPWWHEYRVEVVGLAPKGKPPSTDALYHCLERASFGGSRSQPMPRERKSNFARTLASAERDSARK